MGAYGTTRHVIANTSGRPVGRSYQMAATNSANILFDLGLEPGLTLRAMKNLIRRQIRRPNRARHNWRLGEDCC